MNTMPVIMLKNQLHKYRTLDLESKGVIASYVWIDGTGIDLRSKDRTLKKIPETILDVPNWHYDGSQTNQAPPEDSDTKLCPQTIYKNPFHGKNSVLVLADTYYKKKPTETNYRKACEVFCKGITILEPWFGFNQEFIIKSTIGRPLEWPLVGFPNQNVKSRYCATGADKISSRDLMETFYRCCLYADINLYGINSGPTPSLWNFQIGPSPSMKAADDLWMARYILVRLAEEYNTVATFEPQSVPGSPTIHLCAYYSDDDTRSKYKGYNAIMERINTFSHAHGAHLAEYNDNIKATETLQCHVQEDEMPSIEGFTAGVGDRECSIRIPKRVVDEKYGYLEDRRPVANADPYRIIHRIMKTFLDVNLEVQ